MITEKQIWLVQKTWKIFIGINPVLLGDVFYSKLFMDMPQFKPLFKGPADVQSRKLIDMLNIIVRRLDKLDELDEDIIKLARRHVDYGARPQHYKAVGNALLWTLQQALGSDWNEEVKEAWLSCYHLVSDKMIGASSVSS